VIVSDNESDLRATAEDIATDSAKLTKIEIEKTHLDAHDPRVAELSAESEKIARRIVPKVVAEREIVDHVQRTDGPNG
jgi:hypothetical protein